MEDFMYLKTELNIEDLKSTQSKQEQRNLMQYCKELEKVECILLNEGYKDIALDTRGLIEYIQTAINHISSLEEKLYPVFNEISNALWDSPDLGKERIKKAVDKYKE